MMEEKWKSGVGINREILGSHTHTHAHWIDVMSWLMGVMGGDKIHKER